MQEKERKLYLPEENEEKEQGGISPATESASGQGKPQMRGYARDAAEVLRKKILKQFPVLQPLWDTAEKGCGSDELPKVFYAFNKAAVYYLTSQTTEDYRLSMQHLYTAEAKRRSVKKAVQFEALTPSTSFSTGNGTGTYKERALLFATLARYCGLDAPDWLKNEYAAQNKAVDGFQPAFSAYLKRLDGIFCKDMISAEVKELLCSNEEPNDFIVKLRKEFIKNNAKEFLNYDLVIMDEFQNFPELIGNGNNDKSDAAIIAQEIFGKKDCKVLLLSATPFEINDYIPEGFAEEPDDGNFAGISAERGSSDKKQVFDGFFKLIEFMIGKGERAEEWTNQWSECRSKLRDPVSRETAVAAPSFAMRLKTNCFIGGNSKYRTAYGDSTPFPLTFGRGYSFSEEMPSLSEDWHKSLFLTEDQLSGKDVIPEGYHPRFEKLKEDMAADPCNRVAEVREELDWLLSVEDEACRLTDLFEKGELPLRVTHNDTKINNVLFDEKTHEALVVIDLDTVMPGLVGHDFGDAIRFAANFVEEDCDYPEKAGVNLNIFWAFAEGFLKKTAASLTKTEVDTLALSCFALTCELATRFLADYIVGDKYFKVKKPQHNLVRTRCQVALAKDMLNKMDAMNAIVQDCARRYKETENA